MNGMYVIALSFRCLEKDNVKLKLEPYAKVIQSTKIDTQIPLSFETVVNIKSRPTAIVKH